MAYTETVVVAGGIAHVPVLIAVLKFAERIFSKQSKQFKEN
tara:strand:+ start:9300 stop:9422 length:123 start_codon:yes stop_codon:yes gene_type:complete